MTRFKPGQQVVCVADHNMDVNTLEKVEKGKIYTVKAYDCPVPNFLTLSELPKDWFRESIFEPLMDITEIHEILSAEPITETV